MSGRQGDHVTMDLVMQLSKRQTCSTRGVKVENQITTQLYACRAAMHQATDPSESHLPRHLESPQSVAIGELRPLLAKCRALLGTASKEPPFLSRHKTVLSTWGPVLSSLDSLVTRVAALESLLEGKRYAGCIIPPGVTG